MYEEHYPFMTILTYPILAMLPTPLVIVLHILLTLNEI